MFLMILIVFVMIFSFLFKQKTAYEMRISDWSSDVCSSDLEPLLATPGKLVKAGRHRRSQDGNARRQRKHHRQQRIAKRQDGEHQPDHRIGKAYDDDVAPFVLEVVPSIGQRAAQIASRDVAYVYLRACARGLDMLCWCHSVGLLCQDRKSNRLH